MVHREVIEGRLQWVAEGHDVGRKRTTSASGSQGDLLKLSLSKRVSAESNLPSMTLVTTSRTLIRAIERFWDLIEKIFH